ncbi:hypothetical protein AB4Y43_33645 [Paraburkholderia sp. BR10872]|uniref:hypothetical protein n=1 Tax=Paraburkholderia sp. BR10872 TaxID=3236989 RepID=UPI0034D34B14
MQVLVDADSCLPFGQCTTLDAFATVSFKRVPDAAVPGSYRNGSRISDARCIPWDVTGLPLSVGAIIAAIGDKISAAAANDILEHGRSAPPLLPSCTVAPTLRNPSNSLAGSMSFWGRRFPAEPAAFV